MRSIVLVSALAVLTAACGQIPGMEETEEAPAAEAGADAGTPASAEEAGDVSAMTSDPQGTEALNIESPTVSDIEGYWWMQEDRRLSLLFRDGSLFIVHMAGAGRGGFDRFEYQASTDCGSHQADENGRAVDVRNYECAMVEAVAGNSMTLNYGGTPIRHQRASDDEARDFEALLAAAS